MTFSTATRFITRRESRNLLRIAGLTSISNKLNAAINGCISALTGATPYSIPNPQTLPTQESGIAIRPNSSASRADSEL